MKRAGQIVLTTFPYTDITGNKLRHVLMEIAPPIIAAIEQQG